MLLITFNYLHMSSKLNASTQAIHDEIYAEQRDPEGTILDNKIELSILSESAPDGVVVNLTDEFCTSIVDALYSGDTSSVEFTDADVLSVTAIGTDMKIRLNENLRESIKDTIAKILAEKTDLIDFFESDHYVDSEEESLG